MDLNNFIGKYVEVEFYRKKYRTDGHVRVFSGKLTDVGCNIICLKYEKGRYHWIPKPNFYKDKIKEI